MALASAVFKMATIQVFSHALLEPRFVRNPEDRIKMLA